MYFPVAMTGDNALMMLLHVTWVLNTEASKFFPAVVKQMGGVVLI
jgi:hypothetical protein